MPPLHLLALRVVLGTFLMTLLGGCEGATPTAPDPRRSIVQSQSSFESPATLDFKPVIEALFFGTGPLARLDSPGCDNTLQRMRGWPRGSRVHVVSYASVDAERRETVERTLEQAQSIFGGTLTTDYTARDDADEPSGSPEGEIAVFGVTARRAPVLCGSSATNCQVVRYNAGAYIASRVILSTPFVAASNGIVAHELGHAFGLCHIDPTRAGLDSAVSIMGNSGAGAWTPLDFEAFRLVYGAGLSPGDPRQRFVSAGLIN